MTRHPDGWQDRLRRRVSRTLEILVREGAKFGVIGLMAFIIDTTLYNVLVFGMPGGDGHGVIHDIPLRAKILATAIATVFAWLGNRYWTFRHRRRAAAAHEFLLFILFNVLGLGIAVACLGVSRYLLDMHSQLADNISANGVGLVLGTLFRFWAYRTYVFKDDALADIDVPLLHADDDDRDDDERDGDRRDSSGETGASSATRAGQPAGAIDT